MTKRNRVAIYARVSTDEGRQDPETQLQPLREYARHRGFEVVGEFVDEATGTNEDRPNYRALFEAVRKRRVDVVLVWRFDRFARSTQALINSLKEFQSLGVNFISYQENIDTTTPQGEMVFGIFAALAQFESALISARVRAGMQRARAEGKRTSRPPISPEKQRRIGELFAARRSVRSIAAEVGVSRGTVQNYKPAEGA